ncbi:MAG: L,D-transpeptidase, partial [Pseudomonadota bacterium]|nr:L,D-transpeptidase [Pseudomonadota bacterium]
MVLVAAVAALGLSGPVAAATGGINKQQNITQPAKKRPAVREMKKDACTSIFKCMFKNSGRRNFAGPGFGRSFRQVVAFRGSQYAPGTIVVRTPERALYFVLPEGEAIKYKVGVGREGFQWSGNSSIVRKEEWPSWTPPQQMIEREAAKGVTIPAHM